MAKKGRPKARRDDTVVDAEIRAQYARSQAREAGASKRAAGKVALDVIARRLKRANPGRDVTREAARKAYPDRAEAEGWPGFGFFTAAEEELREEILMAARSPAAVLEVLALRDGTYQGPIPVTEEVVAGRLAHLLKMTRSNRGDSAGQTLFLRTLYGVVRDAQFDLEHLERFQIGIDEEPIRLALDRKALQTLIAAAVKISEST